MENKILKIEKLLNATPANVFEAFSRKESLAKWWGPAEASIDVLKLNFRNGGEFHYKMTGQMIYYGIFKYVEINEPESIVWKNSFANSEGEIVKAPFEGFDFPKEVLNKVTFKEKAGKTLMTMTSEPINASESEINCFYSIFDNMIEGTNAMLGNLEKFVENKG